MSLFSESYSQRRLYKFGACFSHDPRLYFLSLMAFLGVAAMDIDAGNVQKNQKQAVKVSWQQAASPSHMDGLLILRAHWRHLANTVELVLP